MDSKQFGIILAALKSNYSNFAVQTKEQAALWYEMLKDLDGEIAIASVKNLIMTSKFAPTIADIRASVLEVTGTKTKDVNEAWMEVTAAIRNFGMNREVEALASMSEVTSRVVKAMSWRELCLSENQMADRAHFIKIYNQSAETKNKNLMISSDLREQIKALAQSKSLELEAPKQKEIPQNTRTGYEEVGYNEVGYEEVGYDEV